jgi:hypothetical protein
MTEKKDVYVIGGEVTAMAGLRSKIILVADITTEAQVKEAQVTKELLDKYYSEMFHSLPAVPSASTKKEMCCIHKHGYVPVRINEENDKARKKVKAKRKSEKLHRKQNRGK